jgi:hypothetical protein
VKKSQVYDWHKLFRDGRASALTIRTVGDAQGLVHCGFIAEEPTVNREVSRKCKEKWAQNGRFLLHDNAHAHTCIISK